MKRWKVTFGLFLLLFALATTVACAETKEAKMDWNDRTVIFAQPGETIHFTYDVPEDYVVTKEEWLWYFCYTNGRSATLYDGEYGESHMESYTYEPTGIHVEWDGKGSISLSANEMVRIQLHLNEYEYLFAYVVVADPAEYYTYEIQNGEATITGYNKDLLRRKVLIPQEIEGYPVTTIGDRAFYDMPSGIGKEFYIPDNVTTFGKEAFAGSAYLDAVRMPQKLTKMGEGVFAACLQMHFLEIPDSLTEIPDEAFVNCWGYGAGRGDYSVEQCIGKNVTKIGKSAFAGCWNMGRAWGDARLPEKLESIGEGAFQYCYKIKSLEIPAGVTVIPDRTFQGCERLESIQIDGDITMIGAEAFDGCVALTSMPLSKSLNLIGADAFRDCTALTDFQLAEGNTHFQVQQGALMTADATRLLTYAASAPQQSFVMPETLTQIDDGALKNLRYLETLTFSPIFSDYQAGMFENATGLKTVNFGEGTLTAIPDRFFKGCTSLVSPNAFTGVTSVGESAFEGCTAVQSLSFDDSLSNIGTKAFQNCTELESVHIPGSVTSLSAAAFRNDVSLTEFQMPERLHTVSASAFSGCTSLKTVTWSKYLQTIEANAFENTALTEIIFPESLTRIGAYAFAGIGTLESIVLPENLNTIGSSAFSGTGIQTLKLPKSVTTLGNGAWMNCAALREVQWDAAVTKIPASTFEHCTALTQIELPDGIVEIGARAFSGNESLTNVTLPRTVRRIESAAFEGCRALTDILLWPDVEEIAADAFANCENLTIRGWKGSAAEKAATSQGVNFAAADQEISYTLNAAQDGYLVSGCDENAVLLVLPAVHNGLPVVGTAENAFANCKYLQEVRVEAESVYLQVCDGILMDATGKTLLLYPARRAGADLVIDENVTAIADYAFAYCQNLRSITIGTQVETIDDHAFEAVNDALCLVVQDGSPVQLWASAHGVRYASESTSFTYRLEGDKAYITGYTGTLPDVVVPAVIDGYPVYAIENLRSPILTHVVVSEGIEVIGDSAFKAYFDYEKGYIRTLVSVSLPQSLKIISDDGFWGQENLQEITLGSVVEIGQSAFGSCTMLKQITLPDTLTTIGEEAFRGVPIAEVVIPANVTEIADWTFYYNGELRSLTLPDGLKKIGANAFCGASKLQSVELPESLEEIGDAAFRESGLTSITIPGNVKRIGGAFIYCKNLEKVSIAPGVETIGADAFLECSKLTEATLASTVTTIESSAFCGCKALQTINGGALIQSIGEHAFTSCENIEEINISPNLTEISDYAFDGCKKLKRVSPSAEQKGVSLPHVKYIGERAFNVCKAIPSFSLGDSLETVGDYAFASTSVTSMYFPDTVNKIGINPMWQNYAILSVHLPKSLTEIPQGMFAQAARIQTLTIPQGVRSIGTQAFHGNVALAALKLPDGLERIGANAFGNAMLLLEIPASVTEIADDAFSEAVVEFYTPSGSAAHQYALAHQIPVHLDESIPAEYLGTADQLAAKIVAQVITDDMTDYQKAEALVDWMLSETKLSDMLPHTYSGKMVLTLRKGTRWGWAFAYKALLNAANVTNDIYFNAKGIVEGEGIGDQSSVFVSYFDGDAVNMIQIDGQWYFTHPAFVEHFGKARYFMLNRETYRLSFGDDPKVKDCDNYDQTFLYQAYSKNIEAEVVAQASASFTEGKKLVYAEVQPIEELMDTSYAYVLDFAGRHMDTLDWQNAQGEFEPTIIGTNNGYWLSDDLTGEYAQVTVNTQTLYPYGAEVRLDDPEYTAMLCDWNVDGTLTLTEGTEEANVALFTIERGEDIEKKQTITGRKVYHATFTPTLSQYIDTLAPTEFDLVLECQLPRILDVSELVDNKLTLTLSDSHIFPENAQLDLIFWPQDGISSAPITHFYVEDRAELYPDGKREITLDLSALRCDLGYALYIAQTADNYVESEQSYVTSRIDIPHTPYIETVRPATPTEDGLVSATVCRICDTWLGNGYAIASDHILQLPANLKAIEEEAFAGMWQVQQVNIPEGVTAIGKRAFADCTLLRLVIIPNSVQTLADDAFSGCHPVILCDAENQQVIDWANAQGLMVVFKESK